MEIDPLTLIVGLIAAFLSGFFFGMLVQELAGERRE